MRAARSLLGLTVVIGGLLAGAGAAGGATPSGGEVQAFVTGIGNGTGGRILFVGAIGDSGKLLTINKSGKADANGNYVKVTLKNGTFVLNKTGLDNVTNNAQPTFFSNTCSAVLKGTGPVTLSQGTGDYTGISGTLTTTLTFAEIGPRNTSGSKKGQCNTSNNAQPVGEVGYATANGTVSYS